jgi:uncharacterized Zn-binding protein involved in type VI secretion
MPALSRKGDRNNAGGQIVNGATNVFCNGLPVGLHISRITKHGPRPKKKPHCCAVTTTASANVFCEGKPVLRVNSGNNCGHKIVQGSNNVNVS